MEYKVNLNDTIINSISGPVSFYYLESEDVSKPLIILLEYDEINKTKLCDPCLNHNGCYEISDRIFIKLLDNLVIDRSYNVKFIIQKSDVHSIAQKIETEVKKQRPKIKWIFTDDVSNVLDNEASLMFYFTDTKMTNELLRDLTSKRYKIVNEKKSKNRCLEIDFLLNLTKKIIAKNNEGIITVRELVHLGALKFGKFKNNNTMKNLATYMFFYLRMILNQYPRITHNNLTITQTINRGIRNINIEDEDKEYKLVLDETTEIFKYKLIDYYEYDDLLRLLNKLLQDCKIFLIESQLGVSFCLYASVFIADMLLTNKNVDHSVIRTNFDLIETQKDPTDMRGDNIEGILKIKYYRDNYDHKQYFDFVYEIGINIYITLENMIDKVSSIHSTYIAVLFINGVAIALVHNEGDYYLIDTHGKYQGKGILMETNNYTNITNYIINMYEYEQYSTFTIEFFVPKKKIDIDIRLTIGERIDDCKDSIIFDEEKIKRVRNSVSNQENIADASVKDTLFLSIIQTLPKIKKRNITKEEYKYFKYYLDQLNNSETKKKKEGIYRFIDLEDERSLKRDLGTIIGAFNPDGSIKKSGGYQYDNSIYFTHCF